MIFYPEYFIDRPLTALIEIMQLCHLKTETNYMEHKCILDHESDQNYDHQGSPHLPLRKIDVDKSNVGLSTTHQLENRLRLKLATLSKQKEVRKVASRWQRMLFSQALPINHLFCGKRGAAKPNVSPLFFPRANVPGNFSGSTLPPTIENHCHRRQHLKMRRRSPEGGRRLQGKKLFYQKYAVFDVVRCANKVFACQQ